MRILQINATYGIGSTGCQTKLLHENLRKLGHESFVVAGRTDTSYQCDKNIFVPCSKMSKKVNGLKARITGDQNNLAKSSTKRILSFIDEIKPEIIQIGNIHSNFVNLNELLRYIAMHDIALVVVLHDCWLFTGKCTNYIDEACFGWKNHCGNCPKLKKDIPSWFFDKTEKMLKEKKILFDSIKKLAIVGVSERITEDAKNSYVFGGRNCTCIPNVIDDTIFFPGDRENIDGVTFLAGAAYEWSDYKGINDFVQLGKLCSEVYGEKVKIRLAGNIDKLDKKTVSELKGSGVELLGILSKRELADFYRNSDVFISLSKGESYGLSISEALHCGIPVIAYEGYAEKELLDRCSSCKVVANDENIEGFFKYLQSFIGCPNVENTKSSSAPTESTQCIDAYVDHFLQKYEQF